MRQGANAPLLLAENIPAGGNLPLLPTLAESAEFWDNTQRQQEPSPMPARIYKPARSATQSGTAKTRHWVLEYVNETGRDVDPLMGWTSSSDTQAQVRLKFTSKEAALEYAKEHGIEVVVQEPKPRRANVRPGGYGENFATNRRGAWTH
jgi:hypothetical protein